MIGKLLDGLLRRNKTQKPDVGNSNASVSVQPKTAVQTATNAAAPTRTTPAPASNPGKTDWHALQQAAFERRVAEATPWAKVLVETRQIASYDQAEPITKSFPECGYRAEDGAWISVPALAPLEHYPPTLDPGLFDALWNASFQDKPEIDDVTRAYMVHQTTNYLRNDMTRFVPFERDYILGRAIDHLPAVVSSMRGCSPAHQVGTLVQQFDLTYSARVPHWQEKSIELGLSAEDLYGVDFRWIEYIYGRWERPKPVHKSNRHKEEDLARWELVFPGDRRSLLAQAVGLPEVRLTQDSYSTLHPTLWHAVVNDMDRLKDVIESTAHHLGIYDNPDAAPKIKPGIGTHSWLARGFSMLATLPKLPDWAVPLLPAMHRAASDQYRTMMLGCRGEKSLAIIANEVLAGFAAKDGKTRKLWATYALEQPKPVFAQAAHHGAAKDRVLGLRADFIKLLIALGENVEPYSGRPAMEAECRALAQKDSSKTLEIFDMDSMPLVNWQADGSPVDRDVLCGLMQMAIKVKDPEGNGLFDLYWKHFEPTSATAFANWIFKSWVAEESKREAPRPGVPAHSLKYLGSGAASKGVLGLARYADVDLLSPLAADYMKKHSKRQQQAKSMADMLASIDHRGITQILVGCSRSTKQHSVREHIQELVEGLAEKRGWTMDQLADNTIPTGGLDDDGVIELAVKDDEAAPPWQAVLIDDLSLVLLNANGKAINALPSNAIKDTKAQLRRAKAEIKDTIKVQSARLFDAMMAERTWNLADWQQCFESHPIMNRLIRGVIWVGLDPQDTRVLTFRVNAQGGYLDADGDDVTLDDVERVQVAHGLSMAQADIDDWTQAVKAGAKDKQDGWKSLFTQVGQPLPLSDVGAKELVEFGGVIRDRQGWGMDGLALLRRAEKMGWKRGESEGGGFYDRFVREAVGDLPEVHIVHSGAPVVRDEYPVHLLELEFVRIKDLSTLPRVFVNEMWNQYHQLAEIGEYRDDWRTIRY